MLVLRLPLQVPLVPSWSKVEQDQEGTLSMTRVSFPESKSLSGPLYPPPTFTNISLARAVYVAPSLREAGILSVYPASSVPSSFLSHSQRLPRDPAEVACPDT